MIRFLYILSLNKAKTLKHIKSAGILLRSYQKQTDMIIKKLILTATILSGSLCLNAQQNVDFSWQGETYAGSYITFYEITNNNTNTDYWEWFVDGYPYGKISNVFVHKFPLVSQATNFQIKLISSYAQQTDTIIKTITIQPLPSNYQIVSATNNQNTPNKQTQLQNAPTYNLPNNNYIIKEVDKPVLPKIDPLKYSEQICLSASEKEYDPNLKNRNFPKCLSYILQIEGRPTTGPHWDKEVARIWNENYANIICGDGDGEGDFIPRGGLLRTILIYNFDSFVPLVLDSETRKYNIDLNAPDPIDGTTILDFVNTTLDRIARGDCDPFWCEDTEIHLKRWRYNLIEAGAKTSQELNRIQQ
jgi:hypothetical protein